MSFLIDETGRNGTERKWKRTERNGTKTERNGTERNGIASILCFLLFYFEYLLSLEGSSPPPPPLWERRRASSLKSSSKPMHFYKSKWTTTNRKVERLNATENDAWLHRVSISRVIVEYCEERIKVSTLDKPHYGIFGNDEYRK